MQRIMAYAGARGVIVDVLEFLEDDENFGVVLERVGQRVAERRRLTDPRFSSSRISARTDSESGRLQVYGAREHTRGERITSRNTENGF